MSATAASSSRYVMPTAAARSAKVGEAATRVCSDDNEEKSFRAARVLRRYERVATTSQVWVGLPSLRSRGHFQRLWRSDCVSGS